MVLPPAGKLGMGDGRLAADLVKKVGGTEHMQGRYTAVLEKRGKEWLVVHEHMSVPPPPYCASHPAAILARNNWFSVRQSGRIATRFAKVVGSTFTAAGGCGVPSPVTPTPPTRIPFFYRGTLPGLLSKKVKGMGDPNTPGEIGSKAGGHGNSVPVHGTISVFLNRFTSETNRFDNPTPTSGPVGVN